MSYPVAGFPDYSRLQPNGGRFLGALTGTVSTNPQTPAISSTGFTYITLLTNSNSVLSDYIVNVEWGANNDPSTSFAAAMYVPSNDSFNTVQFPVLAEWFKVNYSFYRGPGTETPTTYIYGTNSPWSGAMLGGFGSQSIASSLSVPATSIGTLGMLGISQGNACFGCSSVNAGNWYAQLQQYDAATAGWLTTYQITGTASADQALSPVALLPAPCRIQVHNLNTSVALFQATLIPSP